MTDELKDQRIPIMMSPSEVKAIDDWMWANRIRSRGEAIRRLCKVGLVFDASVKETRLDIWDLYANAVAHGTLINRQVDKDLPDGAWKLLAITYAHMLHNRVRKFLYTFTQAVGTLRKVREIEDIQDAFGEASRWYDAGVEAVANNKSELDRLKIKLSELPAQLRPQFEDFPEIPDSIKKALSERGQDPATAFGMPVSKADAPPKTRTPHRRKK